jgi:Zn ribbon nucleic-acid-binding protein
MENQAENRICQNCKKDFTIESDDFSFYEKMKVPPPTFCPECRLVRRLIMRNERTLYKRKCDKCGESKIVVYPEDSPYKVYCKECFHGDDWDPIEYGQDYDPSTSFFAQYISLFKNVPKVGIVQQGFNINSEYTNRASNIKNCYLIFASADNENCNYGLAFWNCKDSMDCLGVIKCEKCFDCTDCYGCSNLKYSKECNSCIDSWFLLNCRNCQNCFGCTNLRNKNFCIFNEQYSKEEYFNKLREFNLDTRDGINDAKEQFRNISSKYISPSLVHHHSVNVSGNWIEGSKNIKYAFSCNNVEEGKYLFGIMGAKDVMDYTYWGKSSELIYESSSIGYQCANVKFSNESWEQLINSEYCHNCFSSSYLFGCVGLKKKQYCILNKQYTKEEYEKLIPKIKEQMISMPFIDKVGRIIKYGEFFPCDMTPFAYNETIAQEYFPKTKEQAIKEGYRWIENNQKNYKPTLMGEDLPNSISQVSSNILQEVIGCAHKGECNQQCTFAFKIIPDELQFYRTNNIPLPELCPNCRHYERLIGRNPIKIWPRSCMCDLSNHEHVGKCKNEFETSYAPDRPEKVYCEKCYQEEVI